MYSSYSRKLWKWGALFFVGGFLLATAPPQANADETPVIPVVTKEDVRKFSQAFITQKMYRAPLVLKVEGLSAEEVVERVQKAVAAHQPSKALHIEVRDVLPVKLSFGVAESTVGRVLDSTATLAGARLWVFGDYTLLAPEKALTLEEQTALKNGFGSAGAPSILPWNRNLAKRRQKFFTTFILEEIDAALAKGGGVKPPNSKATDGAPEIKGITVRQLSPNAQAMLQQLANDTNKWLDDLVSNLPDTFLLPLNSH